MNKIASFTVNHLNLLPGVYVSRRDYIGSEVVTTFDLRFTRPNLCRFFRLFLHTLLQTELLFL